MKRIQAIATIATGAVVAVALTVPAVAPAHGGSAHAAKRHGHKHKKHRVVFRKRAHRVLTIADAGSPHTTTDDKIGTIDSFTDGVLTLKLVGGKTVEGIVTPDTEIKCDGSTTTPPPTGTTVARSSHHGDDDGPGDDRGEDDGEHGDGTGDYPGDHRGGGHCDHPDDVPCTTADLVKDAVVREAKLKLTGDGLVFAEITIAK